MERKGAIAAVQHSVKHSDWLNFLKQNHESFLSKIENRTEADRIFTILMGDRVVPRQEFIETYGPQLNLT